jgi:hypothetical protein
MREFNSKFVIFAERKLSEKQHLKLLLKLTKKQIVVLVFGHCSNLEVKFNVNLQF